MALYKKWRGLSKNPKLEDACNALGLPTGSHRALADALAAARVLYKIAKSAPEDEVIIYDHAKTGDFDETTMPASQFLTELGWIEKKHVVMRAGEDQFVDSDWMDPDAGEIYPFLEAMDCQRERMMKPTEPTKEVVN
jgi:DNA polymerase III epsilon subunit-like protein